MKSLFFISFLLLSINSWWVPSETLCFKAIQDGREVSVICAGKPVSFRNCSDPTPADATVLFFPGPKSGLTDDSETFSEGESYSFPDEGTYHVTLVLTRGKKDENNQTITELYEQTYQVKATPQPTYSTTLCGNRQLAVTITDKQYDMYSVDFGDGSPVAQLGKGETKNYTYTSPGTYTVSVTGRYNSAICTSPTVSSTITDIPTYTAAVISGLQVVTQDATSGIINFTFNNLQDNYQYTLTRRRQGEASFSTVTAVTPPQTTLSVPNLNTSISTEYRIEAISACRTALSPSNIISNIVLYATAENEYNTVQWQTLGSFQRVELFRNDEVVQTTNPGNTYQDRAVICEKEYCYTIKGFSADGSSVSSSARKCVTSYSIVSPPAGTLLATYNLDNQVELSFTSPEGHNIQEVYFFKSIDNAPPEQFKTTYNSTTLLDELSEPIAICYSASFKNGCAISEQSINACPMLLSGQQDAEGPVILNWTAYQGFAGNVASYDVEVLGKNNNLITSYTTSGTTYTDTRNLDYSEPIRYRIKAVSSAGEVTYSNLILIKQEAQLHIPSAFTPNNDGLNDKFEVKGLFIKQYTIKIYNRSGQVVYTSDKKEEGWDGTYNGAPLPAGAYAYEITVATPGQDIKRRTGTVTLLR